MFEIHSYRYICLFLSLSLSLYMENLLFSPRLTIYQQIFDSDLSMNKIFPKIFSPPLSLSFYYISPPKFLFS